MKKIALVGFGLGAAVLFSGCATIMNGKNQPLTVTSEPSGASVKIAGVTRCTTPCTQEVLRAKDTVITVEKDGYKTEIVNPSTNLESWFWGNIVFGGLPGSTTDISTGAAYQYNPNTFHVNLRKAN